MKNYNVFIRTCKRPLSTQHLSDRGSHYLPSKSKNQRPHRSQDALQALQGDLGETSPTSYLADEKNLRPRRPPASKNSTFSQESQPAPRDRHGGGVGGGGCGSPSHCHPPGPLPGLLRAPHRRPPPPGNTSQQGSSL